MPLRRHRKLTHTVCE
jgi:hypothetical protein